MPLEPDLLDLMTETVTLEPAVGQDRFNNFEFGPAHPVKCYIARANRRVLNAQGRDVISTVQIFLAEPELTVTVNDRLTLPNGSVQPIHEVLGGRDDVGPYWLEVRA